jgi:transglutaminase-like putative cysteine protease
MATLTASHQPAAIAAPHYLPTSLRAVIVASSFWLLSLSLTVLSGSVAALLGCFAGSFLIDRRLHRDPLKRLRLSSVLLLAGGVWLLGLVLAQLLAQSAMVAELLTPIGAFNSSESLHWFTLALAITAALRTLARRTGVGAVIEIIFVAAAIVVTLAAHRNGMIHRPFFLGDFAITRGIDPSTILMAFGCAAVLALAALLMIENNHRRLPYHFVVLGLLCFSLVGYVQLFGLPTPQLTNDLGLTGQAGTGSGSNNDNPFHDGDNTTDDKEAPVAVVVFRDDYEPINGAYYFRESAYSQFNGTMLDYTARQDMDRDLIEHFTASRSESEILPEADDQRRPVRASIGMLVPHRAPFGLVSPVAYENTANPNNLRFKRTYDSYSMAPTYNFDYLLGRELGREDWSEEIWDEYLTLPDDPRYGELASRLTGNLRPQYADDPYAKAWAIKSYLDENGIYSLKNDHAYETDPAASFLFGDLTGYCMHFSFAATYMYRSIGIPARVGVGYSVPASNRGGGSSLLIQAIHGHAWPEIYLRGVGWVIVDPAPQQTLVDMSTDPQNELQQLLGDMLRDEAAFEEFLESRQSPFPNLIAALRLAGALLVALIVSAYLVKIYRLTVPGHGNPKLQYRHSYRAALDWLAAVGLRRKVGESREAFARRVTALSPAFAPLTQAHLSAALGSGQREVVAADEWQQMATTVSAEVRENSPTWKLLLGYLNPFSWLLSR